MAHTARAHGGPLFAQQSDFNDQLYEALKTSPWWMISIAVHVLLFVLSSLFQSANAEPPAKGPDLVSVSPPIDTPPEQEPPDKVDEDPVETIHNEDVTLQEPDPRDVPIAEKSETDTGDIDTNNVPFGDHGTS